MIIKINDTEIECESYQKTETTLHLIGTPDGDIKYSGINWSKVEFPYVVPTLEDVKAAKIAEIQAAYEAEIADGYYDAETGYTLFIDDSSLDDYAKMKANIIDYAPAFIVEIGTTTGWWEMTSAEAVDLLIRYGQYTMPLITKKKKIISQIPYMTEEQLAGLQWGS